MNTRAMHLVSRFLAFSALPLWLTACSSPLTTRSMDEGAADSRARPRPPQQRLVQFAFGRDAYFGICTEPACPSVTPKTRAQAVTTSTQVPPPAASDSVGPATRSRSPAPDLSNDTGVQASGKHITLQFASGAAALDAVAKKTLDEILPVARRSKKIVIAGRTDNIGSRKANQAIALARALQVRDYLGLRMPGATDKIEVDARGACCFIASNNAPEGRRANRRVEVVFSFPGQVPHR